MQIDIVTAFPAMVSGPLKESIVNRAVINEHVTIKVHDLRDWTRDKHKTIDDTPYGGGAGMIFKVEPLYACLNEIFEKSGKKRNEIFLTSPRGPVFSQERAVKMSLLDQMIIICGHYKGVDERIKDFFPIKELSIGDFVLSGGEIPAVAVVDAVVRLIPGVLGDIDSAFSDSFNDYLLDCNYFTRPENFKGSVVPSVLLSGNHKKIDAWRLKQKEEITQEHRPDLYKKYLEKIKIK
ncbi:MAG: tRNA (guanosine(37)-N1)-methyltransferase TrmD [Calditrichales bacterium]|nr:MAG: tRNA (guanosine(37)-N1)-methyltransferase TrmD [Calditrichales bacterium]